MHRIAAIVLILCYAALGSGAMEYWHNAQHAAEDAAIAAGRIDVSAAASHDDDHGHTPLHDESNCPIHAQLHLAGLAVASVPLLVCLGFFVAFLTLLAPRIVARQAVFALPCRGPPLR